MAWPFKKRAASITAATYLGWQTSKRTGSNTQIVSREQALRHSAVWACLRLRADLVSMMPVDVYRRVGDVQIETPKPPVLINPDGKRMKLREFMYSTQFDLDSVGNAFGLVTALDAVGRPAAIELVCATDVVVCCSKEGEVTYRVGGTEYPASMVWHEKQYTMSGCPVGLSPTAYAASSINGYLSAQAFAADWFAGGATPAAQLKNTSRKLNPDESVKVKDRFKAAVSTGDVFVTGNDWEYSMLSAKASEAMFLDERQFGLGDVARFYGVPGDMIDAGSGGSNVTYANVTQRNLQLLIMHLGPAIGRREDALSDLTAQPRYVKLNTDALLRMDLQTRYASYKLGIDARFLAPSEARELENRPPFTPDQEAEFTRLAKTPTPTPPTGAPA